MDKTSRKRRKIVENGIASVEENGCSEDYEDSREVGKSMMSWMINPVEPGDFEDNFWQKQSFVIRRNSKDYYKNLFSMKMLDKILRNETVYFGKNIDVTSYTDGVRTTLNPAGRARASVVWDHYEDGCSVRMLNPQTYCTSVWKLCSRLQEYFRCFVGANVYLTPAGTQGFAPHWDDIDAFILQLEGKKRWRVYDNRNIDEKLPLESSKDFKENELPAPLFDGVVEAGDMLYIPRGLIHHANALETEHSMHITLSSCQHTTWSDLLKKLLPVALDVATAENVEYRESLPLDFCDHLGIGVSDQKNQRRDQLLEKVTSLISNLHNYALYDQAADQMAKSFIHDSLPPCLGKGELKRSSTGVQLGTNGKVEDGFQLGPSTKIRLIRRYATRLVAEEDSIRVYHSIDNSREYHAEEAQYLEVSKEEAMCFEHLQNSYPRYVKIKSLPLDSLEDAKALTTILLERGILQVESL